MGEELARRFGVERWLFTLTATDANRTALRIAHEITDRPRVLVDSYCYHGSVDEAFAVADRHGACEAHGMPWSVTQLGCRAEYRFEAKPARNGTEAHGLSEPLLERYLHLHALNRGVLLTPFHNMALMAPTTTGDDVDRHTEAFAEALAELGG